MWLLILLGLVVAVAVAVLPLRNKSHQTDDELCKLEYIECQKKLPDD
jgi:uncharacterized membrane-anchored protein YhcB (DUF1043 family)